MLLDIKEFLKEPDIQEILAADDLDTVYQESMKRIPIDTVPGMLNDFLSSIGINSLDYVTEIYPHMYQMSDIEQIVIPTSVKRIGEQAFLFCEELTTVSIPNTITRLPKDVFSHCYKLKNVNIPNSVTIIGDKAFQDCSGLTTIDVPNSVTRIGNYAFSYCNGLTSITIPKSVTRIGKGLVFDTRDNNVVVKCEKDSYAHKYCIDNNLKYELI